MTRKKNLQSKQQIDHQLEVESRLFQARRGKISKKPPGAGILTAKTK